MQDTHTIFTWMQDKVIFPLNLVLKYVRLSEIQTWSAELDCTKAIYSEPVQV